MNDFISFVNGTDFRIDESLKKVVIKLKNAINKSRGQGTALFKAAVAFEAFALDYGQYHFNESSPPFYFNDSEIAVRIERVFRQNGSDFLFARGQNYIRVPSGNFNKNGSVIVGVVYKVLHSNETKNSRQLITDIMTVSMRPKPDNILEENITLTFHIYILKAGVGECVFWDDSNERNPRWSRRGCHALTSNNSRSEETKCSCNHMSLFAVSRVNTSDVKSEVKYIFDVNGLKVDVRQHNSLQKVADFLEVERSGSESEEDVFKTLAVFENFFLNYGQYHLKKTLPIKYNNSVIDLRIRRVIRKNASSFNLEAQRSFIKVPSQNVDKNGSIVLGIVYKGLHKRFNTTQSNSAVTKNTSRINTNIMAVAMHPKPKTLRKNIILKFKNLKALEGDNECMFWDDSNESNSKGWSGRGCRKVTSMSNSGETECSCNHMTHFAVLFYYGEPADTTDTDEKILTILTYVGLALSILGSILTIISYVLLTDVHQPLSQIRVSLAGSLGAVEIVFLAGVDQKENTGVCVTVAALMQYFLMAAFCWMLVEGIYLYLFVVKVYNINNKMSIYHVMSWGVPAVMVAMSLSIAAGKNGIQSYVSNDYCWMSFSNNLSWIFITFVVIIEVINLAILVRVVKEIATMQHAKDSQSEQIRLGIKACVVLVPLLGVTWLFGLLSRLHKAFLYIFTILNSIQGLLIFLLHCLRNSQIRERLKTRINANSLTANDRKPPKKDSTAQQNAFEVQPCLLELQ
ncbi:hypothetical protein OS493_034647 [Desmophyllum pertusum]|uniref:Uncharacterized protein n=1 Tax=Desmophyllum pertusum TaxID=174260 RepID=A0A9W9ZIQ2_9CNID|nr:hypothetical protein OS493_034647 [Desmophyllum pertusum]